jgi:hypothetical protein
MVGEMKGCDLYKSSSLLFFKVVTRRLLERL